MAIIGTFTKTQSGYSGAIRTMTVNVKASLVANDKNGNDKAPDFRVMAGESRTRRCLACRTQERGR